MGAVGEQIGVRESREVWQRGCSVGVPVALCWSPAPLPLLLQVTPTACLLL